LRNFLNVFALSVLLAPAAQASFVFTWSTTLPSPTIQVAGNVQFDVVPDGGGYDLVITLKNTSTEPQGESSAALSGLFWNMTVDGADPGPLTMNSGIAPDGLINSTGTSAIPGTPGFNICAPNSANPAYVSCSSTLVGGWQFNYANFNGTNPSIPAGTQFGIGTAGLGGAFAANDVKGGVTPNGPGGNFDYALIDEIASNPNGGFNTAPYVLNQAIFVMTGLSSNNVNIFNVFPAYGTAPEGVPTTTEENPDTPEPATMSVLAGGLALLGFRHMRRR
jgi:hypothetical protein